MRDSRSRGRLIWVLVAAGASGAAIATQSRINGGLSLQLDDGIFAAALSFLGGLLVLGATTLLSGRMRRGVATIARELRSGRLRIWTISGGLSGAGFVLGQATIAPEIGVAMFTLGVVGGQVLGGLAMDYLGVGPSGRVIPTPQRIIGTALLIIAVVVAFTGSPGGGDFSWLFVAPVIIGVGISWQFAVNGLLKASAGNAMAVAFVTFLVGTVVLGIGAGISVISRGWPTVWPTSVWLYLGGALGIVFVSLSASLVRATGVLLLSLSSIAGQLASSVVIEEIVPLANGVSWGMLLGAGMALVAVTVAAIPLRRSPTR